MAIGKDKTQVLLTLTKEDKAELQRIADNENRTFTNLINTIIKNYLKELRMKSQMYLLVKFPLYLI